MQAVLERVPAASKVHLVVVANQTPPQQNRCSLATLPDFGAFATATKLAWTAAARFYRLEAGDKPNRTLEEIRWGLGAQ